MQSDKESFMQRRRQLQTRHSRKKALRGRLEWCSRWTLPQIAPIIQQNFYFVELYQNTVMTELCSPAEPRAQIILSVIECNQNDSDSIEVFGVHIIPYDRDAAVAYAQRWALSRNPDYFDFSSLGGDCTNFASQCLYTGCGIMNDSVDDGWFYRGLNNRSPSWTSVVFLSQFLLRNRGLGPFARAVSLAALQPGDLLQLGKADGRYYHTLVVLENSSAAVYVAAHSNDALWRPLSSYSYDTALMLHILGARKK